jgi:anti-sigma regulatory factor (Ser/Thr protein kinase)
MTTIELPCEASSIREARRMVADAAEGHVDDVAAAVLLTSELVANVVNHAGTTIRVTVRSGPPFRVEVHDGAAVTQAFRDLMAASPVMAAPHADRGRGLALVRGLAAEVGLEDDPGGGKVVWFELR